MSDVQFDIETENKSLSARNGLQNSPKRNDRGITQWLIKKGIVKSESVAKNMLLAVAIICFVATGILVYYSTSINGVSSNRLNLEKAQNSPHIPQAIKDKMRSMIN